MLDPYRIRVPFAVGGELRACLSFELPEPHARRGQPGLRQSQPQTRAPHRQPVSYAYAERREHACQRMHEDAMHAGRAGYAAGVLTGSTAETEQCELAGIEPLPGGNLADGVRHRFDTHI